MALTNTIKSPDVSVLMPVFNGARWLQQSIDSIRNQSLTDFELIIVDDGSTDDSYLIAANLARLDDRIRVVRQAHSGVATALNHGITLSKSKFIARMDADDIAHRERLQKQFSAFRECPRIGALGSWARVIDEQGRSLRELKPEINPTELHKSLIKQNPFIHSSMMFSADLVQYLGGYRAALDGAEDYDLWLRMSEHAPLANIPELLISLRHHATSASVTLNLKQLLAARLARMSAAQRRVLKRDIVEQLHAPLSLDELGEYQEFRHISNFYRLLARSPSETVDGNYFRCFWHLRLNHAERKTAQLWLTKAIKGSSSNGFRASAFFWLFCLHPARALSLMWSLTKAQKSS